MGNCLKIGKKKSPSEENRGCCLKKDNKNPPFEENGFRQPQIQKNPPSEENCPKNPPFQPQRQLQIVKKPVILLYNYEPDTEITVNLKVKLPKETLHSLYPIPKNHDLNQVTWRVIFEGNERLRLCETNKIYPYLFWESSNSSESLIGLKSFVCLKNEEVEERLDEILARKGLNYKERCDMMTFWLHELKSSKFVKIGFLEAALVNQYFPLQISPAPVNLLRIFMVFQNINEEEKSTINEFECSAAGFNREGPTMVEWGGSKIN